MDVPDDPPVKTFTVAEANATLPEVRSLLEQLQGLQRSISKTSQELSEASDKVTAGNGHPLESLKAQIEQLTEHQLQLIEALQSALMQLEELGCVLKDLDQGLVDFYSLLDGELVLLCWKFGEERIAYWHTLEAGFPGRQPLPS